MATLNIGTSRALPLPPVTVGEDELRFVSPEEGIPADAVAYLATAVDPVDAALIERLPASVGLIANLGVGFDNIDRDAAARRGLIVSNTPVVTEDTADLSFALILAAARRLGEGERYLRAGKWAGGGIPPVGTRVNGATLGIVGFGAIGRAVARRATGFGMKILYIDQAESPAASQTGAEYRPSLHDLLSQADIVTLHAPLTVETHNMIDAGALATMKQGAVLVNAARGPLVDENALIAALESGHIAAAGLDVFVDEPAVPRRLMEMEQVVLTPHIGSATAQCRSDMVQRGIGNIVRFLRDGSVNDPVPLPQSAV
ncbi:D-glycerate dehydrogenase [Novosphingobium sp. ZN18A2]|uniref:2-hydroxyacid dehydrogenase n=1 Tax=Novosphingobium sp. ZN18A2 TaxID=3079861 RepID=UPI0030CEF551